MILIFTEKEAKKPKRGKKTRKKGKKNQKKVKKNQFRLGFFRWFFRIFFGLGFLIPPCSEDMSVADVINMLGSISPSDED